MRKFFIAAAIAAVSLAVSACGSTDEAAPTTKNQAKPDHPAATSKSEPASTSTEAQPEDTNDSEESETKTPLDDYSSEQIEYARVWLQLGPNQALDELNVWHIPAGTPLNPDDETSASYPEDVIQLAGSRLVDGSVTYSGNGDGTINVYNVPLRWDGKYPDGEDFYTDIIKNTKLVSIDPGDDTKIIELIKLQIVH